MAAKKDTNGLVMLLLFVAGAAVTYVVMDNFLKPNEVKTEVEKKLSNEYARVMNYGGVLVFIGAVPANNNYDVLDEVKMDGLFEIIESTKSEEKLVKRALNTLVQANQNLSFFERINKFVSEARKTHSNVNAIILNQNFKSATIIKFKE